MKGAFSHMGEIAAEIEGNLAYQRLCRDEDSASWLVFTPIHVLILWIYAGPDSADLPTPRLWSSASAWLAQTFPESLFAVPSKKCRVGIWKKKQDIGNIRKRHNTHVR